MINRVLGILAIGAATTASAGDSLNRHILERAASCWPTQTAMRGISFSADARVSFTPEGHVSAIEIVEVAPQTETFKALAKDFADALKRCGPYVTEGMSEMDINLSWPL
ncbi:MAG: hypothetical protein E5X53_21870 [Mesorhizobium sp.]|uniref:hypothetical protein n=1 Tax=Mesorhizobium sp. TaxID=1871066 RepID=UPI000FE6346A|nr:hypothetical protein [Mesorhizobium sp.]RWM16094.1 MAG: hypothetical protein EOR73_22805 [Mesorhizobium sp.]TIP71372.1 MAG: hypothetical protein E5X55_22880 [Mesorhizobium sp.]TIQ08567.1 MAG: hypothetical protein E5X57_22605 [Mesorhizobium sp.]TIR50004.1 MAG: hypothetical protein E5X53_21870 [Mesorhizobium sp.]TJV95894.1 MAG: hypothetical protein E5X52_21495 [Mesorhizobium sp.]